MDDKKKWYGEGLTFKCTQCGGCCTGSPGYVWVDDDEIAEMADYLEIDAAQFIRRYTRLVRGRLSLLESSKHYDCIFFRERSCEIYSVRPQQCRTYPFWPSIMNSPEAWEAEKKMCPGMRASEGSIDVEKIEDFLALHKKKS